jgi:hypothetical protein
MLLNDQEIEETVKLFYKIAGGAIKIGYEDLVGTALAQVCIEQDKRSRKIKQLMGCYMIMLSGQGDNEIKLVNKETWDWINTQNINPPDSQVEKYIKEYQHGNPRIDEIIKQMNGCKNSWSNDRALSASSDYGETFYDMTEAIDFIGDNYKVIETYTGYIY